MSPVDLPDTAVLLVADIEALYPNIPPNEALRVVKQCVHKSTPHDYLPQRHAEFLMRLLDIQLHNDMFEFEGQSYSQISGIPMGLSWSPAVASIYLSEWDQALLSSVRVQPRIFRRYIDDICTIFDAEEQATEMLNAMQNLWAQYSYWRFSHRQTGTFPRFEFGFSS